MKKIFASAIIIFTSVLGFAQNFEGKITYQNTYKSKMPQASDEQFTSMLGSKQEYYMKGGDYKSVMNGKLTQWQLYINKENKLYSKMSTSETVYWNDAAINDDSVLKVQVNKSAADILGYKCDEVVLTCKSGIQKYYFNTKLGIDTKLFVNHKYGNWYDYLKQSNAVPLKMVIDTKEVTIESVATEIKPMKLAATEFQLAAGTKTDKNPY
ncbi:MAG: hypothetical protein JWO06_819 [Bacteroidota bacterium]|nr:hypothetical protein [Bacteroidota bacterium]